MATPNSTPDYEEAAPFVNEACGDTMWDEVLNQPENTPEQRTPVPPFTLETARQVKSFIIISKH